MSKQIGLKHRPQHRCRMISVTVIAGLIAASNAAGYGGDWIARKAHQECYCTATATFDGEFGVTGIFKYLDMPYANHIY